MAGGSEDSSPSLLKPTRTPSPSAERTAHIAAALVAEDPSIWRVATPLSKTPSSEALRVLVEGSCPLCKSRRLQKTSGGWDACRNDECAIFEGWDRILEGEKKTQTLLTGDFIRTESGSQTFRRVCSAELLSALSASPTVASPPLWESSLESSHVSLTRCLSADASSSLSVCQSPASGSMSPSLSTLASARMHETGKWRSDDRLLPVKQTRATPSLLPPAPSEQVKSAGSKDAPVVLQRNLKPARRPFPQACTPFPQVRTPQRSEDDDITVHGFDGALQEDGETKRKPKFSLKNVFAAKFGLNRTGTW